MRSIGWRILGLASLGLGGLGVALPLLPATPFVLLAAFCFATSSPTLPGWLLRNRAISRKGKAASVAAMALSLALSAALGIELAILGLQALALSGAAAFVLSRNTAA